MHKFTRIDGTTFNNPMRYIESLPNGDYTIQKHKKQRNIEQNALYWVLLSYVASESGNDKNALHELMKKQFLTKKKLVKLGKSRRFAMKTKSTTKLSQKDFSRYYEQVSLFFEGVGYVLPPHDSIEFQNLYESHKPLWL